MTVAIGSHHTTTDKQGAYLVLCSTTTIDGGEGLAPFLTDDPLPVRAIVGGIPANLLADTGGDG